MKHLIMSVLFFLGTMCFAEEFYGQIGQDQIVYEHFFKDKKTGTFVDIGAHNGVTFSNTLFFEKRGWNGICVEPIPEVYKQLVTNRNCICVEGCITNWTGKGQFLRVKCSDVSTEMLSGLINKYDPRHLQRIVLALTYFGCGYSIINVNCYTFNEILDRYGINHVDFLSIDTEGGELDIVASIDFDRISVDVITLEDNYKNPDFIPFLESKGFICYQRIEWDLLFVSKRLYAALEEKGEL